MYICKNCQKTYSKWQGQCSHCMEWNTITEADFAINTRKSKSGKSSSAGKKVNIVKFSDLKQEEETKKEFKTDIQQFDATIGGIIIKGQVLLVAGSPGIGKSTLSLQITENLSKQKKNILYIAGEESPYQIKQRSDRLKLKQENVLFMQETNIEQIENYVASHVADIDVLFVDSVQILYSNDVLSSSGSVSQVSECTNRIVNLAKGFGITTFIIGHITKAGEIAGPKILEHMVDTVLYFEGDKKNDLRILRVNKNRYGPTDEVGIFRMTSTGLTEVHDTKELFERHDSDQIGSVFSIAMEGTRPVIVEVQALASKTYFSNPRRATSGFDLSRLYIILAIIDKKLKLKTYEYDIFINITGGIKFNDSALDLAVLKAVVSSIKNTPVNNKSIYFGEVGLTGEIRKVYMEDKRIKEGNRLGFDVVVSGKSVRNISEI